MDLSAPSDEYLLLLGFFGTTAWWLRKKKLDGGLELPIC